VNLTRGELVRSRVVDDAGEPLATALDRGLDGYLVLEPQGSLLLDEEVAGVVTVADGVPVLAYERHGDHGGRAALDAVAGPGPFRAELYAVEAVERVHDRDDGRLAVTPGAPAERLADDPALAERARERAPDGRLDANEDPDAVEAFLADEERIAAIRERARAEAEARAAEWGLTDQLAEPPEEPQ
jgi:hypothetical protein